MSWLQPSRFEIDVVANVRRRWPEIVPLARLLAAASRVEPLLLRNARLHFLPGSSTELEFLFWFSPLVGARSSSEVILHPGAARVLVHRLWRREPKRFAQAVHFIRQHTRHWSPEDRLEQELRLDAMARDEAAVLRVQHGLQDMLKRLHDNEPEEDGHQEDPEQRRIRLARWSRRTLTTVGGAQSRLPEALWLSQYASYSLGTLAALPPGNEALPPPPRWLEASLPAPYRQARLAIELHYSADRGLLVLHFVAASADAPAIELPSLPANLHVQRESDSGHWCVVHTDARLELAATTRVVLSTITGRRYEVLVELPPPPDVPAQLAPLLYLSHLAEDAGQAGAIAGWLQQQGLRVILRQEGLPQATASPLVDGGEPARLLRLWTPAARQRAASAVVEEPAAGTREALLRIDPALEPPEPGYRAETLLDLPDTSQTSGQTAETDGFIRALHEWLAEPRRVNESTPAAGSDEAARLLAELEDPQTPPPRRLAIGDRLAEIGDPRPGVGVREFVLPEVVPEGTDEQATPSETEAKQLLAELAQPETHPPRRLAIGDRLAEIGDPRRGVGLDARGLPEIDWVEIPGGGFIYQEGQRRTLKTFRMARYPITNAQYQAFIDAGGYREERWWKNLKRPDPEGARWSQPNRPRTNVDWYEAAAFCRWLSAQLGYEVRLPTEEEWERTARGRDGREYPWGSTYESGRANIEETSSYRRVGEWNLGQTTAVGLYPHGASNEGALDLLGNVWEWCVNKYDHLEQIEADTSGQTRVVRGGSWYNSADRARGALRNWFGPVSRNGDLGFRVVSSAPIS